MLLTGSKIKDFYDYANDFSDKSVIFDRKITDNFCWHNGKPSIHRSSSTTVSYDYGHNYILFFCGEIYKLFYDKDKNEITCLFWFDANLNPNLIKEMEEINEYSPIALYSLSNKRNMIPWRVSWEDYHHDNFKLSIFNICKEYSIVTKQNEIAYPPLNEINFHRNKSADEVVNMIYDYIVKDKNAEIVNSPTDMNRFVSKGYDVKSSFRPKIKA